MARVVGGQVGGSKRPRHEGNLADARTQPNNVRPPQKIVEGSARGQCPVVLYEREGSRGQQDCGRAEKKGGQKQQERGGQREGIRKKWRREKKNLANVSTSKRESQVCNGQICAHS